MNKRLATLVDKNSITNTYLPYLSILWIFLEQFFKQYFLIPFFAIMYVAPFAVIS